jgi:hypothetical protein
MATGPMFNGIGLGTYALFAALNAVVIWPVVYFYFPETKKWSLEEVRGSSLNHLSADQNQLDIIFALAHDQGKNPVWVSKSGDIPHAGSREAEAILGRSSNPDMSEKAAQAHRVHSRRHSHGGGVKRVISRKGEARHDENVANRV